MSSDGGGVVKAERRARTDQLPTKQKEMHFPMWVLPIKTFLAMAGPPKPFQELMQEGLLVRWVPTMYLIFVSHQWVGNQKADPEGEQLEVLRGALRNIISGELVVQSGLIQLLAFGHVERMEQEEVQELADGYLWLDWFSIPQITMRTADGAVREDVRNAVRSIPSYVQAANMFVALVPCCPHRDKPITCNHHSWESRGWCRVELAAAAMSSRSKPMRLVRVFSEKRAFMFAPFQCGSVAPGLGDFTVASDREVVFPVMKELLEDYVEARWTSGDLFMARLFASMRGVLLSGLGASTEDLANESLGDFLRRFRFQSLEERGELGFGPVACAAVSGNTEVLRALARARADMNEPFQEAAPELMIERGTSPLSFMLKFAPVPEVLRVMIELRADLDAKDAAGRTQFGMAAMGANIECIKEMLKMRASVDDVPHMTGGTVLLEAAATGHSEVVEFLLEQGASVDAVNFLGHTALSSAVYGGSSDCLHLILEKRADVNDPVRAPGALGCLLPCGLRLGAYFGWLPASGPLQDLLMSDGATPAFQAARLGHTHLLRELLEARADPSIANSVGVTPLETAMACGHSMELLALLQPPPRCVVGELDAQVLSI